MFGNSKPFGTGSAFGSSSFGSTSTPFGQGASAFGAKPATGNVFGGSSFGAAPSGGGLFGVTNPTPGTGLFGQPSTAFGTPAASGTGGFGFTGASSGGLFGSTPATQTSGGLFGNTSASAFGTPRPSFGGFSSTTTPGTGLFGQTAAAPGTGLFGSSVGFGAAQSGTTIKFNPPSGSDTMMKQGTSTTISTRHQCITCMKEYENKSLEELRAEDYAANRKGGSTSTIGGFGAPQTGLFGNPAASSGTGFSFGAQSKPLFGGTAGTTNSFGTGGLFGQPAPAQNTGLFGKPVGFGAPASSAAPVFNFGASSGTSLFGQNTQQKSLFGQNTGSTGLFGNPATTQSSGFGTGFGTFGAANQQSGGLFGAKPTGFGAPTTTSASSFSFGNTSMSGGLFGQKPATGFGTSTGFGTGSTGFGAFNSTPASGTGLFGQNKPATGFGQTSGSMFGSGLNTGFGTSSFGGLGSNTGTGFFGSTANKAPATFNFSNPTNTGFGFGASNPSTNAFSFGTNPSAVPQTDPNNNIAILQNQQQILAMTANPFGDNPLFRNSIVDVSRDSEILKPTNPSAQKALLNDSHYKVSLLPTAKIKPVPWSSSPSGKGYLFDGLEDEEPGLSAAFVPKKSVKKLVLKNVNSNSGSMSFISMSLGQNSSIDVSVSLRSNESPQEKLAVMPQSKSSLTVDLKESSSSSSQRLSTNQDTGAAHSKEPFLISPNTVPKRISFGDEFNDSYTALATKPKSFPAWTEHGAEHGESALEKLGPEAFNPTGIILQRPGYYMVPSLSELIERLDLEMNCFVDNFTVGREGFGKVTFLGVVNVANLNLDEIVFFNKKEIIVYPDDENKPPVDSGLNRKAEVTLENVWPTDKTSHSPIKDSERIKKMGYREKIEKSTIKLGATFVDYKPETGSWTFKVEHFSKYGIEDSDDEDGYVEGAKSKFTDKGVPISRRLDNQVCGDGLFNNPNSNANLPRRQLLSYPIQDQDMETMSMQMPPFALEMEEEHFMDQIRSPLLSHGIDMERIQGMKASFFEDDMEDENYGYDFQPKKKYIAVASQGLHDFGKETFGLVSHGDALELKHAEFPESPSMYSQEELKQKVRKTVSSTAMTSTKTPEWLYELPIVKSVTPNYPVDSPIAKPYLALEDSPGSAPNQAKIFLKSFEKSTLYDRQSWLADAGYYMGRSFKVGWSADGAYVHPVRSSSGSVLETYTAMLYDDSKTCGKKSQCKSNFVVSLQKLQIYSSVPQMYRYDKMLVDALELQLQNSVSTIENGSPLFLPKPGAEPLHVLSNFFENELKNTDLHSSQSDIIKQCVRVWNLMVALWGNMKGAIQEEDMSKYAVQLARREAVSKWLIQTTEQELALEIASTQHNNYLHKIFIYLCGRKIGEAIDLAQQHNNFRLSLLLAQAEINSTVKNLMSKQLHLWSIGAGYEFIDPKRIAIYALLSGLMQFEEVNCCENLKWKQAFSLHLWYFCNPNCSIQEVMEKYDDSFQGSDTVPKYAASPFPAYIETVSSNTVSIDESDSHDRIYDTCYHLLKLYCDRSHRFDLLLMPETYTSDHLDYRLSWLLHSALSSIGYNVPEDTSNTLHSNFASQLESLNLWQWEIFVILHHSDAFWRAKQVKEILLRHLSLEQNEEAIANEAFLVERLMVPKQWIFETKAIIAHASNKKAEEAWFLLKAGSWSKSHAIVKKYLAPDAVINEDFDFLLKYLKELSLPENCCTILDWQSGGQVLLDYINLCQAMDEILSREVSAYEIEKYTPEVVSLCKRLSSIPATSLKEKLYIAEMAKKTATILRSISIIQAIRSKNTAPLTMLASHIKNLPMPYDYAISENRFVTHCFLDEFAVES